MKWLFLLCGIILGAVGAVGAMNFLTRLRAVADQNDQIIFAGKAFYNSEAVVTMTGTLTGPHLAYPNNTYNITCYRDRKECVVSSIEQIGHNQISTMYAPLTYPIVKWSTDEIIAKDETGPLPKLTGCLRTTICYPVKLGEAFSWCCIPAALLPARDKRLEELRSLTEESVVWNGGQARREGPGEPVRFECGSPSFAACP